MSLTEVTTLAYSTGGPMGPRLCLNFYTHLDLMPPLRMIRSEFRICVYFSETFDDGASRLSDGKKDF